VNENAASHRQQNLYWNQMVEIKVAAEYMRRYRDHAGKRVTALATLKAIASQRRYRRLGDLERKRIRLGSYHRCVTIS
jgi:hypothetical protein